MRAGSGKLLRVVGGRVHDFATGLASVRERRFGTIGADDVSVAPNGSVFTAMVTDDDSLPAAVRMNALGDQLGALLRFGRHGRAIHQADVGLRSEGVLIGHPYGVLALAGSELVTDSQLNRLLEVRGRTVKVVFHFPAGAHRADSVPTTLALGPDGAVYIGELSGFGAGPGQARIWRMAPGHRPKVFATGFSSIIGLAFGPDGSLYVCEFGRNFDAGDPHGDVVRLAPDGTRTRLGVGQLFHPGGVAVGRDGTVYVSNWSTLPGRPNRAGHRGQLVAISG